VDSGVLAYVPAEHFEQTDALTAPTHVEKLPCEHEVHLYESDISANVPAGHAVQRETSISAVHNVQSKLFL
jgi:hypothetical protein